MQVFGFPTSPFVRKVLLVAAEKGLAVELIPATPHQPTAEFLAASPFRQMPAMQDGDFRLADSTAIAFYLDAKAPDPPLLPTDPQGRGRAIWLDEFADTILSGAARGIAFNRYIGPRLLGVPCNDAAVAEAEVAAARALDWLEGEVPRDGWLLGDAFTLADIAVASCLATLAYGLDFSSRPRIAAWYKRVCQRPAWRKIALQEAALVEEAVERGTHRQS